jgi:hypothetical protein
LRQNAAFAQFSLDSYTARLPELQRWKDLYTCIAEQMTLNCHESRREVEEVDSEKDSTDVLNDAFSGLSI